jgi:hypothetical protein
MKSEQCQTIRQGRKPNMDQQQKQNINQASEQLTDSTQQVFRLMADRAVARQESNLRLTQNFFQNWVEQVNNQAHGTHEATQTLRDQATRQREAIETLSQEATNAYSEVLNSSLSFYQQALSTATQVAQGNMQQGAEATQQSVQAGVQAASQAASQAMETISRASLQGVQAIGDAAQQEAESVNQSAQQAARGGEQVARSGAFAAQRIATGVPIQDYDNLNVGEIAEQLDNLAVDELQRVRDYEKQNKDRDGLLGQLDRKINAAS